MADSSTNDASTTQAPAKDVLFNRVLFSPLSETGATRAVRRINELVAHDGAPLTLFGVVDEPSRLQRALRRSADIDELLAAETNAMEARLRRCRSRTACSCAVIAVETGDPALSIIHRVLRDGHDLVVVTTDEDEEDQATIKRLLRKCPCPVWVIRPSRARTQRVLAAVNPDPSEAALNAFILRLAASMFAVGGGELHLVHAWELYGEERLRSSAFLHMPDSEVDALVDREYEHHRRATELLLDQAGVAELPWHVHLEKGQAADVIRNLAKRKRINLMMMGTVARTGVAGLIMGNTAERVLDSVRCSVVAVKPPAFVSPVSLSQHC